MLNLFTDTSQSIQGHVFSMVASKNLVAFIANNNSYYPQKTREQARWQQKLAVNELFSRKTAEDLNYQLMVLKKYRTEY